MSSQRKKDEILRENAKHSPDTQEYYAFADLLEVLIDIRDNLKDTTHALKSIDNWQRNHE